MCAGSTTRSPSCAALTWLTSATRCCRSCTPSTTCRILDGVRARRGTPADRTVMSRCCRPRVTRCLPFRGTHRRGRSRHELAVMGRGSRCTSRSRVPAAFLSATMRVTGSSRRRRASSVARSMPVVRQDVLDRLASRERRAARGVRGNRSAPPRRQQDRPHMEPTTLSSRPPPRTNFRSPRTSSTTDCCHVSRLTSLFSDQRMQVFVDGRYDTRSYRRTVATLRPTANASTNWPPRVRARADHRAGNARTAPC